MPLDRAAPPGSRSGARAATGARLHWCGGRLAAAAPGLMRDGTGSGSWSCRRGCTRVAGGRVGRAAAMTCRDAAPPETARPRPRTRPRAQVAPPACRPARSAFFGRGIGIADAPRASVFALAHHHAGLAPGAALLPAQAALVQGAPDRERADPGQPVWSLAQGFLQQAQGPRRRAVLLALGRARPFGQNALLRVSAIADPGSASMARLHGREPVAVEVADPGGDRLIVPSSDLVGGSRVARAIRNGQQHSSALDLRGGSTERAAQAGQGDPFVRSEWAQRVFAVARHGTPQSTRITPSLYQSSRQMTHEEVRATLARVFERFALLRNGRAVQRDFAEHGLKMPRLIQHGAEAGRIVWVRPTYQMIQQVLTSPVYAGFFVYGRRKQEVSPGDPPLVAERRRPMEEWDIIVPDTYPAYIGYDQYLVNRRHLRDNLYNFAAKGRGAPREGRALLQGLVVCGRCGRRMSVSHGSHHLRYQCRRAQADYAAPLCQAFPVTYLDRALGELFLEAVKPAAIETTLAALAVLERERRARDRHWQLRIDRARYEAQRAQRQYDAIEPENRLVARTLEARWNAALEALEQLEQEYTVVRRTELLPLDEADRQAVWRLAEDLPALWGAA